MRIAFICGSLEPGKDGVGDYTRRLAGETIRQGNLAVVVALNDFYVVDNFVGEQVFEGIAVPVLRVPVTWSYTRRFCVVNSYIESLDPQWLSLQFVSFAFQKKGLPFFLTRFLKKLGARRNWHIMFHELWVGQNAQSTLKNVWWGKLQQCLLKYLVFQLKPTVIHTQCLLYQILLSKIGVPAQYLPLFTNIPVIHSKSKFIGFKKSTDINENIVFVVFGTIHPGAPIHNFAKEAAHYEKAKGIKFTIKIIGRCGKEVDSWSSIWRTESLNYNFLGEKSPEYISEILSTASFGISTTPIGQVEKSGTFAAMRAHNLPVINVAQTWKARGVEDLSVPSGIIEYRKGNFEECLNFKVEVLANITVSEISRSFANSLSNFTCKQVAN